VTGHFETTDGIAHITWDNPPVNSMGLSARRHLDASLARAIADPGVRGIVLAGEGRLFCGGADVREFNTQAATAAPSLLQIIARMDDSPKPIVAAIRGVALGGGLELALGCHGRVAALDARLGLPEVKLGLLPAGGGTQRLPRLIPVAKALDMMINGTIVAAEAALASGIVDLIAPDPVQAATVMARDLAGGTLRRVRDLTPDFGPDPQATLEAARKEAQKSARGAPAPLEIVANVATLLTGSFEEGLADGLARFLALVETPESKALRHGFFAERAAGVLPGIGPEAGARPIRSVGIVGAGTMGTGIAMAFANAGIAVAAFDSQAEALARSTARIDDTYASAVKRGRLSQSEAASCRARITPVGTLAELGEADLIIEAVIEDMDVKQAVFRALDGNARPGAILATNTSFLDVDQIAACVARPGDVLGLHFFSPANIMRLLEIVRGAQTAPDVLATAMRLARTIGKVGVVSGVCDGFIGNRMLDVYVLEAYRLVLEGASPAEVDGALRRFGMAMGPFAMSDMAGNDIAWYARRRKAAEDPSYRYPRIADDICERGWFGQKTGLGWHSYAPGDRTPGENVALVPLLEANRREIGLTPRRIADDEIVDRCIYALVNEGAAILQEGIAARASDIDVVYLAGYGFPALRGGPIYYADSIGLPRLLRRIQGFAGWTPSPLLVELAQRDGRFNAVAP
jgi:3-hydroxyacyl-CoA dehydrogenase